jgi:outer membrane protein assembly factor BamB
VYVGSCDSCIYAINPDGTAKWRYNSGTECRSSPALTADGTVYIGSRDGCLHALNPDGSLKWLYEAGRNVESSPTIGPDGTIYFASDDGYLYALKGTSPLADSPWPKFHHDLANTGRVGGGQ